ncbi:MAG: hypothetical protein AB7U25_05010 [Vicinamibacterales bacterium]
MTAVLPLALTAAACSRPPEQQFLTQFFRAARARDNTTLAMMSAVSLDPREQGTVEDFTITSVTPENRTPLDLKSLLEAERQARDAESEFAKRKMEYQNANLPVIEQVVKLERDPKARLTPAQQVVKAAWDKWREDSATYTRAVSAARAAVVDATGPAEASLTQPGQPPFDPSAFTGEMVSKDVVLDAEIRNPQGQTAPATLTVTMTRAVGTLGGEAREGRWIITRIAGV